MKVLQLGVGSVGEVTARTVAAVPEVSAVVLADIDESRPRRWPPSCRPARPRPCSSTRTDGEALVRALVGVDLVINGLIPRASISTSWRRASRPARTTSTWRRPGPATWSARPTSTRSWPSTTSSAKAGLTALVFFGIDPGASDVFARALYDQFDTVER